MKIIAIQTKYPVIGKSFNRFVVGEGASNDDELEVISVFGDDHVSSIEFKNDGYIIRLSDNNTYIVIPKDIIVSGIYKLKNN